MALFQIPNKMNPLQAAQVNAYQKTAQKEDLLTLNKNLQYEESAFNKTLMNATTLADLPKGHLFGSDQELIDFKNNHDPSTVDFDSYLKMYGQEEAMARVLNNSNAASAILGYGKTIDLKNTKWNPEAKAFDVIVRTDDEERGESRSTVLTRSGEAVKDLFKKGGRAAVEEATLPPVGIDQINFFLEQIKSQSQNATGGFSALENIGGMDKKGANIDWFQGNTRDQLENLAEIMAGSATGAGAGTEAEAGAETGTTTQMSGGITVDNIDSLGITTNIAISDRNIINKIIEVESGGKPDADSGHAKGLMQLKDSTADKPGLGVKPVVRSGPNGEISAEENVRFGTDYFDALTEKYDGDLVTAAMAYNAGTGVIDKWIEGGRKYEDLREETQNYVAKVFGEDVREQVKNGTYGQGDDSTPAASGQSLPKGVDISGFAAQMASAENPNGAQDLINSNFKDVPWAKEIYEKGPAPFGLTPEEFASDKYSNADRRRLLYNEEVLVRNNIKRVIDDTTEGLPKTLTESFLEFFGYEDETKMSKEDSDNLDYVKGAYGGASKGPFKHDLNDSKLKEIFAANPALIQQFQEDPIAFALAYKENPEDFEGKKISTSDISKTIKDSPFKFTAADSKALYDGAKSGDVQTFANSLSTIMDKYVGVEGVPLEFQNAAVALLGSADNFIANSGQQRLDQHIISGMWATLDDDQRKTYAPYLMRFVETGRFSFEGITAANQTAQVAINAGNLDVNRANAMKIGDAGKNLNKIRERMQADDYVFNSNDITSAISFINQADIGGNPIDLQAGRDAIGEGMKQWVGSQKKGWWNSIVSNFPIFGTGGADTPNAAFATQPDLLAYTAGGELVTRSDQEVGYFTRTAPGNPQIKLPQSKISAYWANNELAPEGLQYLTALAIANSKVKASKQGG